MIRSLTTWAVLVALGLEAEATPARPAPKSAAERATIETLRYRAGEPESAALDRLARNLARDCLSYGYTREDRDLMVKAVMDTYPAELKWRLLTSPRSASVCVLNFVLIAQPFWRDPGRTPQGLDTLKRVAAGYVAARTAADPRWAFAEQSAFYFLTEILSTSCRPIDVEVFAPAYRGYARTADQRMRDYNHPYLGLFTKNCRGFSAREATGYDVPRYKDRGE